MTRWLGRAAILSTGLGLGCVAREGTWVGAHDSTGTAASGAPPQADTSTTSLASGPVASTGGGDEVPPSHVGRDGNACVRDTDCTTLAACQDARCDDGSCVLDFYDDRCDAGQGCTVAGCGPSPAPCASRYTGVILCDDFEHAIRTDWNSISVGLTQERIRFGDGAVRAMTFGGDQRSTLTARLEPPQTAGMLALRSHVYLSARTVIEDWALLYEMMQIPVAMDARLSVDLRSAGGLMIVNRVGLGTIVEEDLLELDRWYCIEVQVFLHDTEGTARVLIDGRTVLELGPQDTLPDQGLTLLGVGSTSSPASTGIIELFLDDVVFATEPVGCD